MRLVPGQAHKVTDEGELILLSCPGATMAYLPPLGEGSADCGADTGRPKVFINSPAHSLTISFENMRALLGL
jgi:hypothetical protein